MMGCDGTLFSRKPALDGVGAMKSLVGFGKKFRKGKRRVTMLPILTALKWTAWSVSRCRDRGLGETGRWVAI